MMFRVSLAALCVLTFTSPSQTAAAQNQSHENHLEATRVTGKALTRAFRGLTHEGAYNLDPKGQPGPRFEERHFSDGRVSYTEDGLTIKGQWAVTPGDTICYAYDSENIDGGCFRVYQTGSCFYFYSSFVASGEDGLEQNLWTARSVKRGEHATCEDMIS